MLVMALVKCPMTAAPTRRKILNINNNRLNKKIIDNFIKYLFIIIAEILIEIKNFFIKLVSITTKSVFILFVVVEERKNLLYYCYCSLL